MLNKKYILTDNKIEYMGRTLYQIKRVSDNLLGGYIESEKNLSQDEGECFVYDNGRVYGNGIVSGDSRVYDNGRVFGNGVVFGNGAVFGNGVVYGNGRVYDNGEVFGNGVVFGDGVVYGNGAVFGDGRVFGNGVVCDNGRVFGDSILTSKIFNCILNKDSISVTDKHVSVGCEIHTFDYWQENVREIGMKNGYSEDDISEYELIILTLINQKVRQLENVNN